MNLLFRQTFVLLFFGWAGIALASGSATDEGTSSVQQLSDMVKHPQFFTVMTASGLGWCFGYNQNGSPAKKWLSQHFAEVPPFITFLADMIVFIVFGGLAGTAIYNPAGIVEAMMAGLSWPLSIQGLIRKPTE